MEKEEKFIKTNVAIADFSQGQQWPYSKAPNVVKMWLKNKCILFETIICSLVNKDGRPIVEVARENQGLTSAEKTQAEIDKVFGKKDENNGSESSASDKEKSNKKEPDKIKPKAKTSTKKKKGKKRGWPKGKKRK